MTDIALDEKALEAACAATVLGEDADGKPFHLEPQEAATAIRAYLHASPSQVAPHPQASEPVRVYEPYPGAFDSILGPASPQPANPAQVTDAMTDALVLMVDAFLSRNGGSFPMDEVTEEQRLWKKAMKAAYAVIGQPRTRERDEKLAAIGAGGQAVALPPITDRGLAGQIMDAAWPEFGGDLQTAEFWNDFGTGVEFTLKALSQPHPADERVVEALRHALHEIKRHAEFFEDSVYDTLISEIETALSATEGQ